jgi:hypothetical protein
MITVLDTIHLNFTDTLDQDVLKNSSRQLETYKYYKKITKLFDFFDWNKNDFNLQRLSQRFKRQYNNGVYIEIKTLSLKNEKSNSESKIVSLQLKGLFMLESGYKKLQELLALDNDFNFTVSKVEVAIDSQEDFVFETMKKVLIYRENFIKMRNSKYTLNFSKKSYESINVENTVNVLKVYSKTEELKQKHNKSKEELYYKTTNFNRNKQITRLEIGLKTKSYIDQDIVNLIAICDEKTLNQKIIDEFFLKIQIQKRSKLKELVKKIITNS